MKNKLALSVPATLAFAAAMSVGAPPAHAAYTGNAIRNAVQPSLYKITVSPNTSMTSAVAIWPQRTSAANVRCFVPALTSHSPWGGIYYGGVKRCFNTYNNGTLTLYSGLPSGHAQSVALKAKTNAPLV